ncbi:ABC transporter substrate-binding protein [Deminuibacter soli]|uniref:Cobalamin-binding protein n=1 Tax=Deminuibacter soli TaxID=2291815 RepID=A0A3E1NJ70_9BACT|nr:helical backbone metal receptor [Deminuibacter soli]RFM27972.1 cobalamin-binding protein [Deminuibacter soli]
MITLQDQLQRTISLPQAPTRIVCLVPSLTAWLHSLGLEEEVVGITKFCVHPQSWFRSKTRIGGTKDVHVEQVQALQPQLIIASKEENVQQQVELLYNVAQVYVSDVHDMPSALEALAHIGLLTGRHEQAALLLQQVVTGFRLLPAVKEPVPAAYLIWQQPYMTAGGDTFIHAMLRRCGLHNVFGEQQRYPQTTLAQLRDSGCRLVLLSTEPYPFKQQHVQALQAELPGVQVQLADGEMFSWYGSTMLQAPDYFRRCRQQWAVK